MAGVFDQLMVAHPRIRARNLGSRLVAGLNQAYGFRVDEGLELLDADSAEDALEVLQAAAELAATVTRSSEADRQSGIWGVMQSLMPPPSTTTESDE